MELVAPAQTKTGGAGGVLGRARGWEPEHQCHYQDSFLTAPLPPTPPPMSALFILLYSLSLSAFPSTGWESWPSADPELYTLQDTSPQRIALCSLRPSLPQPKEDEVSPFGSLIRTREEFSGQAQLRPGSTLLGLISCRQGWGPCSLCPLTSPGCLLRPLPRTSEVGVL